METNLKIHELKVSDLIPYANNAKKHPEKQIREIANSIEEFGNCDPIAVWHNEEGQAEIVEGHGRVMALKLLGIEKAPVIFLDHLTDEQRRVYTHVHNQSTLSSDFDYETLVADMDSINADWEQFGFDAVNIADALGSTDDFKVDFTEEELSEYEANSPFRAYNVILCCLTEEEQQYVADLLNVEGQPKRLYLVSELMNE